MIKKWRMILCNTEILISNCCDFNCANLLVRGNIAVTTNITRITCNSSSIQKLRKYVT